MPAELSEEGLSDLIDWGCKCQLFKLLHHFSATEPTEITAIDRTGWIFRKLTGQLSEVGPFR